MKSEIPHCGNDLKTSKSPAVSDARRLQVNQQIGVQTLLTKLLNLRQGVGTIIVNQQIDPLADKASGDFNHQGRLKTSGHNFVG